MPPKDPYKYFRIEARELLEGLQRGVAGLTGATADPAHIPALLRLAHTLKGAARVVRLTAVSELAHRLEDVLAPSRESTLPVPAEQVAELQRLLEGIAAGLVVLDRPAGPAGAAPRTSRGAPPHPSGRRGGWVGRSRDRRRPGLPGTPAPDPPACIAAGVASDRLPAPPLPASHRRSQEGAGAVSPWTNRAHRRTARGSTPPSALPPSIRGITYCGPRRCAATSGGPAAPLLFPFRVLSVFRGKPFSGIQRTGALIHAGACATLRVAVGGPSAGRTAQRCHLSSCCFGDPPAGCQLSRGAASCGPAGRLVPPRRRPAGSSWRTG